MTTDTETTIVRRSIVVEATIDRAFSFFTRDIGQWWDPDKHLLQEPLAEMIFEPHVGGHIIDRGVNGTENRWGTVLVYEPPAHVAFSWDISLSWQIETDPAKTSEVH
nr:ATPase [Actinomycetota bacterium]